MSDPRERIRRLRDERRAVLLAHYYQRQDVQAVADHVGDSLGLAQRAAMTPAQVIVFCGVRFMAETAAVLCPDKTVLLPDPAAGCPMADMATARTVQQWKRDHPDGIVVAYVNSTAAVKAQSDICCTSANATTVVRSLPEDFPMLFVPDRNLGHYVRRRTGRRMDLWRGWCPTHERMLPEHVSQARRSHPQAAVVVHPECRPAVVDMADAVASTSGILAYCESSEQREFIVGTENGFMDVLRRRCPDKVFYPASPFADCPNMKRITLEKIVASLEGLSPVVAVPHAQAAAARRPLERMLALGREPVRERVKG